MSFYDLAWLGFALYAQVNGEDGGESQTICMFYLNWDIFHICIIGMEQECMRLCFAFGFALSNIWVSKMLADGAWKVRKPVTPSRFGQSY